MKALTDKIIETLEEKANNLFHKTEGKEQPICDAVASGIKQAIDVIKDTVKSAEFEEVAKEMIKHLNHNPDKYHPHMKVIIDAMTAELVEGKECVNTDEYLKD